MLCSLIMATMGTLLHPQLLLILIIATLTSYTLSAPTPNNEPDSYFWHITDFHMDVNYSTAGNPDNSCWKDPETDISIGFYGNYRCDSPYTLVQAAMEGMKTIGPKPDFILWTGDDKAHVSDTFFNAELVLDIIQNLTETINGTFPGVPVVPVLGNHDWYPTHQLPPLEDALYIKIGELWKPWIKEEGFKTFKKGGYYTVELPNNVHFVVLNTALYYKKNKKSESNYADPGGQFAWFSGVMKNLTDRNQKAYVTSHVPPGIFERHMMGDGFQWLRPRFNRKLVELIVEHSASILGLFFAHHHTDSFRLFYDESGKPVNWMLIAPAVTPWNTTLSSVGPNNPGLRKMIYNPNSQEVSSANNTPSLQDRNPAIRLVRYVPKTGQIKTFEQYYLNLTKANEDLKADWQLEYDAQEDYDLGPSGITPETLDNLVKTFTTPNRTLFDRYYLYNSVSYEPPSNCDDKCKDYQHCVITNVDYEKFKACNSGPKGNSSCLFLVMVMAFVTNASRWFSGLTT